MPRCTTNPACYPCMTHPERERERERERFLKQSQAYTETVNRSASCTAWDVWQDRKQAVAKSWRAPGRVQQHTLSDLHPLPRNVDRTGQAPEHHATQPPVCWLCHRARGRGQQNFAQFHFLVAHIAVNRQGRDTGALACMLAAAAIKGRLMLYLSMTLWRGRGDFSGSNLYVCLLERLATVLSMDATEMRLSQD